MSQPDQGDKPRQDTPSKNSTEPDRTVQKAKERWEGEGGSAPGKLNHDDSVSGSAPVSK